MGLYNLLLIQSLLYQKFQVLNINKSSRCSRILIKAQKKKKKKNEQKEHEPGSDNSIRFGIKTNWAWPAQQIDYTSQQADHSCHKAAAGRMYYDAIAPLPRPTDSHYVITFIFWYKGPFETPKHRLSDSCFPRHPLMQSTFARGLILAQWMSVMWK